MCWVELLLSWCVFGLGCLLVVHVLVLVLMGVVGVVRCVAVCCVDDCRLSGSVGLEQDVNRCCL